MPLFGAHMSIAGGYHNRLLAAQKHQCETASGDGHVSAKKRHEGTSGTAAKRENQIGDSLPRPRPIVALASLTAPTRASTFSHFLDGGLLSRKILNWSHLFGPGF